MKWDKNKIAKSIWGGFCLFGIILFVEDFHQAFYHPELYPFGTEGPTGGIWYYESQELYLWSAVIWVCWFTIGALSCLLQHKFRFLKYGFIVHCSLTLLYIFLVNTYWSDN